MTPGPPASSAPVAAPVAVLVAEAARKSRVCWLSYRHGGGEVRNRLVWHVWHDEALVVVDGDGPQRLPGIATAEQVSVTLRAKESRAALVTVPARPEPVAPGTPAWDENVTALLAMRLNLRDAAATRTEWAASAQVVRLRPAP